MTLRMRGRASREAVRRDIPGCQLDLRIRAVAPDPPSTRSPFHAPHRGTIICVEFSPKEYASRIYERVSDKVTSIDVANVKESMKGSLQNAGATISSYWQDLQVPAPRDWLIGRA